VKKYLLLVLLALPILALANSGAPPAFDALNNSMMDMATGPFGSALALTMLVMGFGIGVAKNSPAPVISAVMGMLFLHFAPAFIANMMGAPEALRANGSGRTVQVVETSPRPAPLATLASAPQTQVPVFASKAQPVVAVQAASPPVVTVAQQAKPVEQVANLTKTTKAPGTASSTKTLATTLVSHTVPVPSAVHPRVALKAPAVPTPQLTKWLGLGGGAIILSLVGLFAYMSTRRKAKAVAGYTPGSIAPAPAISAFMDPHGFKREKRVPTFGHESA
jgi:conjugal transfer pilus assembly protein TraA